MTILPSLAELVQEQAARAKTHAKEEADKGLPKVSVSDPEARAMRLADGAVAPAWNVQVATANGFVMAIDPTDRRNDGGLAPGLVDKIAERCGRVMREALVSLEIIRAAPSQAVERSRPTRISVILD